MEFFFLQASSHPSRSDLCPLSTTLRTHAPQLTAWWNMDVTEGSLVFLSGHTQSLEVSLVRRNCKFMPEVAEH